MLQDELADEDFQVIAVAIDEDADKIRPFTEGVAYPVLLDADHVVTELYAISNVPTVVLIDADDTIVQPNWNAYATDTFKDFTGVDSGRQLDAIRTWVRDGTPLVDEDTARQAVGDLTPDEEQAKLLWRIALHHRDAGDADAAARCWDRAAELAPHDWTIRRAMLPLRGGDPFGEEFFTLAAEFQQAGRPYHGISDR